MWALALPIFKGVGGFFIKNWEAVLIVVAVGGLLWFVHHHGYKAGVAEWKPKYEAAESQRKEAVAANTKLAADMKAQNDAVAKLKKENDDAERAAAERKAKVLAETKTFEAVIADYRRQAKTPAAQEQRLAEIRKLLFGAYQARGGK